MKMKSTKFFTRLIAVLSLGIILSGCIKEENDECIYSLNIRFAYTLNPYFEDRFGNEVDHVELFIYNSDGTLYKAMKVETSAMTDALPEGKTMKLNLPVGKYTVVAWGNLNDTDYVTMSKSDLTAMQVELNASSGTIDFQQAALFHGMGIEVEASGKRNTHAVIDMIKDVSDIKVVLYKENPDGTEVFSNYTVEISGKNGLYTSNNSKADNAPDVAYVPWSGYNNFTDGTKKGVESEMRVMRLFSEDDMRITVKYKGVAIYEEPLTELIKLVYPTQNKTDEDFDRYDYYVLPFAVNGSTISIGNSGDINGGDLGNGITGGSGDSSTAGGGAGSVENGGGIIED